MAEKTLKTRIIHKHGLPSDWDRAVGFNPKEGEIIVYQEDTGGRLKVGNGTSAADALPFIINKDIIKGANGITVSNGTRTDSSGADHTDGSVIISGPSDYLTGGS